MTSLKKKSAVMQEIVLLQSQLQTPTDSSSHRMLFILHRHMQARLFIPTVTFDPEEHRTAPKLPLLHSLFFQVKVSS